jgi:EAL domain-containing protein (putative c-di-GMP-specific phosphodiesterase class I)
MASCCCIFNLSWTSTVAWCRQQKRCCDGSIPRWGWCHRENSLDDFGTGFSSLGYLRNFDFDVLKIDKTFIDELANTRDYGLVASIVSMGRILGMKVVAEGVEEADQVERLKQIGCDFIQGFYYSRPLPAQEFQDFVSEAELRNVG